VCVRSVGTLVFALAACVAALAVAGCGGSHDDEWPGPPAAVAADGSASVEAFAEYQESVDEDWERSTLLIAAEYLDVDDVDASRKAIEASREEEGTPDETVVVELDGLLDDSVRAQRWTLELESAGDVYRLVAARRALRCQPGRGHEDFSAEPCA
jgi:hypothetical protein